MTQPDIEVALDFAIAQTGKPYSWARPIKEYANTYDCSALVIAALIHMFHAAGLEPPADLLACSNTVDLYNWGKKHGYLTAVDKAVRTRGAILIKGRWWGYGVAGHTCLSEGNGREMAAHGRRSGIHEADIFGGRAYLDGLIINDGSVFYKDLQPPIDPKVIELLLKLVAWGERVKKHALRMGDPANGDITILNQLLVQRGLMPTNAPMNFYSSITRDGVVHFKKLHPEIGNIVGKTFGGSEPAVDAILAAA